MKKIIALFMMLIFGTLYAQNYDPELPNIVPPSPEASSLGKYVDIPVSHYTGLPNISIPLYTIKQKDIEVPIQLSYHARGIQLSEISSRVGLGWSLMYGGSLSRQIRGIADEGLGGYDSNKGNFKSFSHEIDTRRQVYAQEASSFDFYPDLYSFNVGGTSGKFIFSYDTPSKPLVQSYNDVKVEFGPMSTLVNVKGYESFTITDASGNKFYFGKSKDGMRSSVEYQISVGQTIDLNNGVELDHPNGSSDHITAWMLMDIETFAGDLISYSYDEEFSPYWRKGYDFTPHTGPQDDISTIKTRCSKIQNYSQNLKHIVFNQNRDTIFFENSETKRLDFEGYALKKVTIKSDGKFVKSFEFNHVFTESTDTTNMLNYFVNNTYYSQYFYRMFLSSVEQVDQNGNTLPPHEFIYDSQVLPATFSSRQDYWGYYNGATNNGPFTRLFNYGSYTPNRRVDTLKSEAGILKEIKYPTGGKTKFTYEHNRGYLPSYKKEIILPAINPVDEEEIELKKEDFNFLSVRNWESVFVTVPANQPITFLVNCFHVRDERDISSPDCLFEFMIDNSPLIDGSFFVGTYNNGSVEIKVRPVFYPENPDLYLNKNKDFRIRITYDSFDPNNDATYAAGKRIKKIEHENEDGVISVKEYEYFAGGGSNTSSGAILGLPAYIDILNHNTYNTENDGLLFTLNNEPASNSFASFQPNKIGYSVVTEYIGTKSNNIGKIEYSFTNMSDTGGDYFHFPYHPPTDNEWLRGKNTSTRYYKKDAGHDYSMIKEITNKYSYGGIEYGDFESFPPLILTAAPNTDANYVNFIFSPDGEEHSFDTNADRPYIHTRTYYKKPMFMPRSLWAETEINPNFDSVNGMRGYRIYYLTGGVQNLIRSVKKEYLENGKILVDTTRYSYSYNRHYQLSGTKIIDSKGDIIESKNYYPKDILDGVTSYSSVSSEIGAIDSLFQSHRFSSVVKNETIKNDNLLSTSKTLFDNTGLFLPKSIQTLKGIYNPSNNTYQDRIIFHDYDSKGNILEVSEKDGTKIYYVWGYNQTVPIAKIEGYTSLTAAQETAIQNAISSSNNDTNATTEDALRTTLTALRDSFASSVALITTYTYDPLVGVTSITDPRGNTIYYEYDEFNRLQFIKDRDGNIVSENQYNYKN